MSWSRCLLNNTCGFAVVCAMTLGGSSAQLFAEPLPSVDWSVRSSIEHPVVPPPTTDPVNVLDVRVGQVESDLWQMVLDQAHRSIDGRGDTNRSATAVEELGDPLSGGSNSNLGGGFGHDHRAVPDSSIYGESGFEALGSDDTPISSTAAMTAAIAILGSMVTHFVVTGRRRKKGQPIRQNAAA